MTLILRKIKIYSSRISRINMKKSLKEVNKKNNSEIKKLNDKYLELNLIIDRIIKLTIALIGVFAFAFTISGYIYFPVGILISVGLLSLVLCCMQVSIPELGRKIYK